jgi:hypothetical protein
MAFTTVIKLLWISLILILLFTITKDCVRITKFINEKIKFSNYLSAETSYLDRNIKKYYLYINNAYAVMHPDKQERYLKYQHLDTVSIYGIDKIFHDQFQQNNGSRTNHELEDLDDLKRKIVNSRWDKLVLFYQKLFHYELLAQIYNDQSRSYLDGICPWQCAIPITEDSIYIGSNSNCLRRGKYTHSFNGINYDENYYNEYPLPFKDTIIIVSKMITNYYTYLDTVTASQTIAKRNGRWWNINSPDPISR